MKSVFHNDIITLNSTKNGVIRPISSRYLFCAVFTEISGTETNHSRNVKGIFVVSFLIRQGTESIKCWQRNALKNATFSERKNEALWNVAGKKKGITLYALSTLDAV